MDFVRDEINFKSVDAMKERILSDLDLVKRMHEQDKF